MRKPELDHRILEMLKKKTKGEKSAQAIRSALSRIRNRNPSLTLNASAEIYAKKQGFSISKYLNEKDRESLSHVVLKEIKISPSRSHTKKKLTIIATYKTDDKLLRSHLDEINKTYTYGCYTATFVLCRKVLENLIIHHILRKKYPENKKEHREKYYDFNRRRFLTFEKLLSNLRNCKNDFVPEEQLVKRICDLASAFKETANEMTHSLYHIATKSEIDDKAYQNILDLMNKIEKSI